MLPLNGNIYYDGDKLRDGSIVKDDISILTHKSGLYSNLTIRENLDYWKSFYRNNLSTITEALLREFDLNNITDRVVRTLSKGQTQKLAIIRSLIPNVKYIFLDEPLNGLDVKSKIKFSEILYELKKNKTILISTHGFSDFDIENSNKFIFYNQTIEPYGKVVSEIWGDSIYIEITMGNKIPQEVLKEFNIDEIGECTYSCSFVSKVMKDKFYNKINGLDIISVKTTENQLKSILSD